jgi:hypothetical protein
MEKLFSFFSQAYLAAGVKLAILKPDNPAPGLFVNPTGDGSVNSIIVRALSMLIYLAGFVATFYLILGAYYYLTAGASDDMVKKAKKIMTNAVIGLAGVILSYVILSVVVNAINGNIGA